MNKGFWPTNHSFPAEAYQNGLALEQTSLHIERRLDRNLMDGYKVSTTL